MTHARTAALAIALAASALLAVAAAVDGSGDSAADALLARIDRFPHVERIDHGRERVLDHVIGLGAMQKVRGNWRLDESERLSGELLHYTWRVLDGFSSAELYDEAAEVSAEMPGSELLYACEARACGGSVQWANRVFGQRVLYGTEQSQRYRVYGLRAGEREQRLILYASARSSDRQYLHMELLTVQPREAIRDSGER